MKMASHCRKRLGVEVMVFHAAMACLLIAGCAGRQQLSEPQQSGDAQQVQTGAEAVPLFVHLISPRYYTDPQIPPKRIVTTRISLGQDFSVSVGDTGPSHSYSVGGPDPYSYSGDAVLAGRVERCGASFFAHLLGRSHSTVNHFVGQMELEKPAESQGGGFSGAIWSVRFVLSTNADCSVFLKK